MGMPEGISIICAGRLIIVFSFAASFHYFFSFKTSAIWEQVIDCVGFFLIG